MDFYLVVFLLIFLSLGTFIFNHTKIPSTIHNLVLFGFIVLFGLICATRSVYTQDTLNYIDAFYQTQDTFYHRGDVTPSNFEIGYMNLCVLVKNIFGNNYQVLFFIIPLINSLLLMLALKEFSKYLGVQTYKPIAFFLFYISFYGLYYSGVVLRAGIAISIMVLAIAFFLNRKYFRFVLLSIVAFTFHDTALAALLVLPIVKLPVIGLKSYRIVLLTFLGLHILQVFNYIMVKLNQIMIDFVYWVGNPTLISHVVNGDHGGGVSKRLIVLFACAYIISYFMDENDKKLKSLYAVWITGLVLGVVLNYYQAATRFTDYFCIIQIFVVYYALITSTTVKSIFIRNIVFYGLVLWNFLLITNSILFVIE